MTTWTPDHTLDAPDGHVWLRGGPDDCPGCGCCTRRLCERAAQVQGFTRPDLVGAVGVPCEYVAASGDRERVSGCPCTAQLPVNPTPA